MKTAKKLIEELPLDIRDTARLILETYEELGTRAEGLSKNGLIHLLRRVMRAESVESYYSGRLAEAAAVL